MHYRLRIDTFGQDGRFLGKTDVPLPRTDADFLAELAQQAAMVDAQTESLAAAGAWAIEQAREAWQAEGDQDGAGE